MGKVRDEATESKSTKAPAKGGGGPSRFAGLGRFAANLLVAEPYKATQGWYARLWTAIGLGALVASGLFALYRTQLQDQYSQPVQFGIPAALGALLGWLVYRTVHFPPFADFLIATEAEMNKVSWSTWPELKRATIVVLVTVLLLALYLFGVDLIWQALLKFVGVLRFSSQNLGSQAG
jgi:preprotein translocase subunit SecE